MRGERRKRSLKVSPPGQGNTHLCHAQMRITGIAATSANSIHCVSLLFWAKPLWGRRRVQDPPRPGLCSVFSQNSGDGSPQKRGLARQQARPHRRLLYYSIFNTKM